MVTQHFMELLAGSKVLITRRGRSGGSRLGPPARRARRTHTIASRDAIESHTPSPGDIVRMFRRSAGWRSLIGLERGTFLTQQHAKADGPHLLPVSGHGDEHPGKPAGHGGCLQGQTTQENQDQLLHRVAGLRRPAGVAAGDAVRRHRPGAPAVDLRRDLLPGAHLAGRAAHHRLHHAPVLHRPRQVLRHLLPASGVPQQDDAHARGADDRRLLGDPHLHLLPAHHARMERHRHRPRDRRASLHGRQQLDVVRLHGEQAVRGDVLGGGLLHPAGADGAGLPADLRDGARARPPDRHAAAGGRRGGLGLRRPAAQPPHAHRDQSGQDAVRHHGLLLPVLGALLRHQRGGPLHRLRGARQAVGGVPVAGLHQFHAQPHPLRLPQQVLPPCLPHHPVLRAQSPPPAVRSGPARAVRRHAHQRLRPRAQLLVCLQTAAVVVQHQASACLAALSLTCRLSLARSLKYSALHNGNHAAPEKKTLHRHAESCL
ncbi:uncharacterized protein htr4 isoform X2 [Phyllopteryx taeniolatus]|uniref:uncharacterized protein htr4 isoform X2 n=1 Tax=Phyllopteryx taeniolatus TaxID=161469 RepID=UPI002AD45C5C|nr:uncharacterized protein htr4 isoform X2 [Phyllopteryx taeniolatus]